MSSKRKESGYEQEAEARTLLVLCYMIMLCMNIFLTIFRSFFSRRLVFSKVIFILMFRVLKREKILSCSLATWECVNIDLTQR